MEGQIGIKRERKKTRKKKILQSSALWVEGLLNGEGNLLLLLVH